MKIYYLADVEERKYEGRSQTATLLKKYLRSKGFEFVNHPLEADLIHVHSSGISDSFRASRLKKRYRIPVIYSLYSLSKTKLINHIIHHVAQIYYLRPRKTSFLLSYSAVLPLKLRGFKLRKLDLVITPSFFVKRRLFKNSKIIRLGIDTNKFKPFKKPKKDITKIKVGYFGHPNVGKGLLDFAHASKFFPDNYESYVHISDISSKMIRNLKKINSKLIISGYVNDINKAYNDMEIIVLPYKSYLAGVANPLVLLEAMACGKAIITTNFEYIKEIVKDSAILIKPNSPWKIVKAVKQLNNSDLRTKLGDRAREIIVKEFSQKIMFKEYLKLYKRIESR